MKAQLLTEENVESEFTVWNTNKVNYYIEKIIEYNKDNRTAITELLESIDLTQKHLSYRSMGLGYSISNPFTELGLSVYYELKYDVYGTPYISIYRLKIDFGHFGLIKPIRRITENKQYNTNNNTKKTITLTEGMLRQMIKNVINELYCH